MKKGIRMGKAKEVLTKAEELRKDAIQKTLPVAEKWAGKREEFRKKNNISDEDGFTLDEHKILKKESQEISKIEFETLCDFLDFLNREEVQYRRVSRDKVEISFYFDFEIMEEVWEKLEAEK